MTTTQTPQLTPEEIVLRAGQQVPYVRMPQRGVLFAEREMRLRQLAVSHAMRDYLLFVAEIAHAQHALLQDYPETDLPDAAQLTAASKAGQAPLPATLWRRHPAWREGLRRMLDTMLPRLDDSPAGLAVRNLHAQDGDALEQQADRLLNGMMFGLDMAAAPLVAGALQAYWTHMVTALHERSGLDRQPPFARTMDATMCPCCGSHPTASILRIGAESAGHRYLHCSLCSAQWHMVRIKCARCQSTKGIKYQSLAPLTHAEGDPLKSVVQAETCDECGHYLKIMHMERDPNTEPVADDLASVALDMLLSEAGMSRHGVNPMLLYGDDSPAGDS